MSRIKKEDFKYNFFPDKNEEIDSFTKINWNQFYSLKQIYSNMFFQNIIYLMEDSFSWKSYLNYNVENNKALIGEHYILDIANLSDKFIEKGFYNKKTLHIDKKDKIDFYIFLNKEIKPHYGTLFINSILNKNIHNYKFKDKTISFNGIDFPYLINPVNFKEESKKLGEAYLELRKMKEIILYKQFFIDIENIFKQYQQISSIDLSFSKNNFDYNINLIDKNDSLILDIDSYLDKYKKDDLLKIKNIEDTTNITITTNIQSRFNSYKNILNISQFNFFFFPVFKIENKDYFTDFINIYHRIKEREVLQQLTEYEKYNSLKNKRKRI